MTGKVKNKNKKKSQAAAVWRRLKKNKMAVLGPVSYTHLTLPTT